MRISSIVLAGGKSQRFGRDKIQENIGSRTLLQWVLAGVSCFKGDIILVTNAGKTLPRLAGYPGLRIVTDIHPGMSALGGIYTGLSVSRTEYNLVVAGDIPFLNQMLLRYMSELTPGNDAVVPRLGDWLEPLHAIYARSCLGPIEVQMQRGELTLCNLFDRVKVRYVESEEIDRFDPRHLSFFNINTQADLEKARKLAEELDIAKCA